MPGDPGEPICDGDHPGDKPDASEAPDGEKLGPPGVMPLAKLGKRVLLLANVFFQNIRNFEKN